MYRRILAFKKTGMVILLLAALCIMPALASTVPVDYPPVGVVGTATFTIIPDKTVYSPGDKITYEFTANSAGTPAAPLDLYNVYFLDATLDPAITGITVDTGNIGITCTVTGNTVSCDNPNGVLWILGPGNVGNNYPKISGTIKPGTPQGTQITTSGSTWVELDYNLAMAAIPFNIPDTNIVTAGHPSPEFPSMFLPVTMIIGFLGAVLFIRRTRDN